ncbi:MAG: efflux RND transporter periplasmic adaptor subunit [Pseudomonadota bacterium]
MSKTSSLLAVTAALAMGGSVLALGVASNFDAERAKTIVAALAHAAVSQAHAAMSAEGPAPARSQAAAPSVAVLTVSTNEVTQWEEFTGRFEAVDHVDVRARVSGYLEAVHFKAGQMVNAGDLLFTIDRRPFEARVSEARAALTQAEATRAAARSALTRAQQLTNRGHSSQAVLDEREEQFATAEAAVVAAKARLRSVELDLTFTEIRAPVDGRISDDAVTPGNLITGGASSSVLTTIVSTAQLHFVFDATEQQLLSRIRTGGNRQDVRERLNGMPVQVRLIDESSFGHAGHIDFVDNTIDRLTGTIRARAILDNQNGVLTPGMFGRMRLADANRVRVALIPDQAIGTDQTQKFVWVLNRDDKAERRPVEIAGKRGQLRIVTKGLADGERVVTSGLHRVASGRQVNPRPTRLARFSSSGN